MKRPQPSVETILSAPDWHEERKRIRAIALDCGLVETVKWAKLCYMAEGANVAIFFGLKACCGLGFFKGALMSDPEGHLHRQGPNSQAVRMLRYASLAEVDAGAEVLRGFIGQAVALEKAGAKVAFPQKNSLDYPPELLAAFEEDPALQEAFEALTPGRRRGYVLHMSGAKQSKTRTARIDRCRARILRGKGLNDR
ncbi:YdeI/OmpD-associated family protein [Roseisalinus antarcticus]|uniref:YdhG-like domain-containing protein n=1 Tax=Roseisalinus antarcticus TaxID=254357 RepID=A0A1Y5SM01_9RHOB|nr:YdeI/OmpD-associated family protein [Roseisalinus antarcticus]SLN43823.1 hypothetical protein ROA7023_01801 [Roseisalinus antarcticus]